MALACQSRLWALLSLLTLSFTSFAAKDPALSLEDSVGQLMLIYLHGETLTQEMEKGLAHIRPCGILYYDWSNGLTSPQQVRKLSSQLQSFAQKLDMPRLWICIDQEGGRVMRLRKGGYTHFPSAMAIGLANDLDLTYKVGRAIGEELAYSGINLNFGPVVDIYSDVEATIIGNRCFASTPDGVSAQAGAWMRGLQSVGVKGCIKHFPGHGAACIDTHQDLARVDLSKERLERMELVPYKELAQQTYAVMTAHILVPSLDESRMATKSPAILQNCLKKQIGFEGIIFADSLVMGAATPESGDIVETSVDALMAGTDVLMYGGKVLVGSAVRELTLEDLFRIKKELIERAKKDPKLQARVYEAADKIVEAKKLLHHDEVINWNESEHQQIAKEVAQACVKWAHGPTAITASDERVLVAASPLSIEDLSIRIKAWGASWNCLAWQEAKKRLESSQESGRLVLYAYEAWKDPLQKSLLELAHSKGWSVVILALGTPRDASIFDFAHTLQVSSPDPYSLERAYQLLTQPEL